MTSTTYSRDIVVQGRTLVREIHTREHGSFQLPVPRVLESGTYRADLDPATRTATIREEAP